MPPSLFSGSPHLGEGPIPRCSVRAPTVLYWGSLNPGEGPKNPAPQAGCPPVPKKGFEKRMAPGMKSKGILLGAGRKGRRALVGIRWVCRHSSAPGFQLSTTAGDVCFTKLPSRILIAGHTPSRRKACLGSPRR